MRAPCTHLMQNPDAPQAAELPLHAQFTITSGTQQIDACTDLEALKRLAKHLLGAFVIAQQGWMAQMDQELRRPEPCAPRSVETV